MNKNIFVNVDTQNDFMLQDGKLPIPGAEGIVGNLKLLTDYAINKNILVVNTKDWHDSNTEEISDNPNFKDTFPEHCMAGSSGADLIPEVDMQAIREDCESITIGHDGSVCIKNVHLFHRDLNIDSVLSFIDNIVILKDKFDVFSGNKFAKSTFSLLQAHNFYIYGVASDVCVDFAVKGLASLKVESNIFVVEDAIEGLSDDAVAEAKSEWKSMGVKLVSTQDVLNIND